jgi:hypothetical protein
MTLRWSKGWILLQATAVEGMQSSISTDYIMKVLKPITVITTQIGRINDLILGSVLFLKKIF